jgi:hypothetical protein
VAEAVEKLGWEVALGFAQFILKGTDDSRGRLHGSMGRQDEVLGSSAGPFVLMIHAEVQWAINFVQCACRGVFQQPQPISDMF